MQTTLTTNTSTSWFTSHTGKVFLQAAGAFGRGRLTIEVQLEDTSTTQRVGSGAYHEGPVSQILQLASAMPVRFTLEGSTDASIVTQISAG